MPASVRGRSQRIQSTLWELALAAIKTFVVLYITIALGRSIGFASLVLAVVAAAVIAAALTAGRVADRIGHLRVMRASLWVYAAGLAVPLLTSSPLALVAVIPAAFAAGVVMTLPTRC